MTTHADGFPLTGLPALQSAVSCLKAAHDELNLPIQKLEEELQRLDPCGRVEVWVSPLLVTPVDTENGGRGSQLGYYKIGGAWHLCIRHMTFEPADSAAPSGTPPWRPCQRLGAHLIELRHASRAERRAAIGQFDVLLAAMTHIVQRQLTDLQAT